MIKPYCEKCHRKVSPTSLYQDKKTLKSFCEACFIASMFEEKDVTTKINKGKPKGLNRGNP
jgi:hypothetical protein